MKIKDIELSNNVLLAPMAGVTDKAFRLTAKAFGPALMYTEMVSGKGLFYNSKKTAELLGAEEEEKALNDNDLVIVAGGKYIYNKY